MDPESARDSLRAVLFDLDGTLLDSLEDLADAMNQALTEAGFAPHPVDAYRYFVGEGIDMLVYRALPEAHRDDGTFSACLAAMRAEYARHSTRKTRPYPGIPELLDELGARGIPAAVLSNKPHDATLEVVSLLLNRWPLRPVLGAKPGGPRKPDPTGAFEVARKLRVEPGRILYVGDTATDMTTAVAAGMHPIGALWGFRTAEELRDAGAEALLAHPLELLRLL